MTASASRQAGKKPIAKLFMHGRSQAVRLPKEFRFKGTEVRVSRLGDKVILEPTEKPSFDVKTWRAKLRALGAEDFLPQGRPEQPPMPDHEIAFRRVLYERRHRRTQ
jgi:antitoxin VapB